MLIVEEPLMEREKVWLPTTAKNNSIRPIKYNIAEEISPIMNNHC